MTITPISDEAGQSEASSTVTPAQGAFDSEPEPNQEVFPETTIPIPPDSAPAHFIPAQYTLTAQYNHAKLILDVQEQIAYTHNAVEAANDLALVVEANRYPEVFQLNRIAWGSGDAVENFTLGDNRLLISLPEPLQTGSQVSLELDYTLTLPPIPEDSDEYKPVPFGYTLRQTNLVDWYPFIPPYEPGAGWLVHEPWFFGEHQVYDIADFEVEIEAAGSVEPLVLAASTLPESQQGNVYRYRLARARTFVVSLSPYYQVLRRQVEGTTVLSYSLPYFENGAQAALDYTAEALSLYNQLFGLYPRPSLSVVVADFLDGMEYEGLYFLSRGFFNTYDGTPAGYLAIIAVHETAHQWWYGQVGNDQALEPWLDEALCTYTELLYYENLHPDLVDWWWAYRVNFYEPRGFVDGSVYDYAGFRPYRDAVYLQGAHLLHALRQRVGEDTFAAFLSGYLARMSGKLASTDDFFTILGEYSEADVADLRQEFFKP